MKTTTLAALQRAYDDRAEPESDDDGTTIDYEAWLLAHGRTMHELLLRLADAVECLDGTTVENERLVDDYRAWVATAEQFE
jgi:hypothetical protein